MKRLTRLASLLRGKGPAVGRTPADVVHAENKWRLLRYRGAARRGVPVLVIPSLINRHYVLDLMPGKSFVEWLVGQGHDVFMIDWGTPADEDRYLDFDEICDRYLGRALRVVCRVSRASQAHVLGYCLGGTLAAIHVAVRPERVASLTALAAPIAFGDEGLLAKWTRTRTFDVDALVDAMGLVPWPLMQAAFHLLRPTQSLTKAVALVERVWDDEFVDAFVAIERWGNDNVGFPGACYRRYIQELYRGNALMRGTFTLSGLQVDLGAIRCPVQCVTFEHDHIVPWRSAAALLAAVSSEATHHIHLPGGHVGAVVSRRAAENLWPQLSAWWRTHDPAAATTSATAGSRGELDEHEPRRGAVAGACDGKVRRGWHVPASEHARAHSR